MEDKILRQLVDFITTNQLLLEAYHSSHYIAQAKTKPRSKVKMVDTSTQNPHLIQALQRRLHIIPLEKCPTRENLFQFFDQQWKEMDSISD